MTAHSTCRWFGIFVVASAFWLAPLSTLAAEQDDATYRALVQRVEGGDFTVDFRSLSVGVLKIQSMRATGDES
jgi:hypothetical protein